MSYFLAFVLELNYDIRLIVTFFTAWFYLRFFMRNSLFPNQVGDGSPEFALHTFFPPGVIRDKIEAYFDAVF